MSSNSKKMLESKLTVYLVCYQEAEKKKDQKRMNKIETFIDDLREEISNMN